MVLTETGESRVNGYLFVLERSLRSFLPRDTVTDVVREIESHLRDRIAAAPVTGDERPALERILAELGPPLRVAQAYSAERTIDEALTTGRFVPMLRAMWHLAVSSVTGFGAWLGLFIGSVIGWTLIALAIMKPIFPNNVGVWVKDDGGFPRALGAMFPVPPGQHVVGGYWVVPIFLSVGLLIVVFNYRASRRFLAWWRRRRTERSSVLASG